MDAVIGIDDASDSVRWKAIVCWFSAGNSRGPVAPPAQRTRAARRSPGTRTKNRHRRMPMSCAGSCFGWRYEPVCKQMIVPLSPVLAIPARRLLRCMSPVLAHRVDSLRCRISEAIGAKRTCSGRRERVDL